MALTGMDIGGELAQALGLPDTATDIVITVGLNELVSVLCRYYPSEEAFRAGMAVLTKYRLEVLAEEMPAEVFTAEQRRRLFRQGLLRGEAGVESPYLQCYLARKEELAKWHALVEACPPGIDLAVIYERIAVLIEQVTRMEAGEAV